MPAKSKNQQQFMGMVHGLQKGEIYPNDVSKDVEDTAKSMKPKDAKDFASTKHKGLPTRVKNEIVRKLREYGTVDDRHHAEEPNFENFPQSWLDGRGSSANEPKIYDKDRDYGDTNFRKKDSGQDDLDESGKEDKNGFVDNATSSTAWLMGREGRKFQKATYDKDGTYDGENFVSKNSGQPDLEEDATFQLKQFGTLIPPDVMADMNKSKSIKSDLIKTLNDFYKRNHINRKITEDTGNRTLDTIRAKQLANALDKLADKITATKKVPFEQVIFKLEDLLQDNKYKRTNMKMVNPQLAFAEYSNGDNTIKMTIKNQSQISIEVIK